MKDAEKEKHPKPVPGCRIVTSITPAAIPRAVFSVDESFWIASDPPMATAEIAKKGWAPCCEKGKFWWH